MTRKKWVLFTLLLLVALALRFFQLDEKPPHHDETINGWHVLQMWKNGYYRYDPTNYHGPLLFYWIQWAEVFFGESVWTLRAVPALCSALTVGVLGWWALRRHWAWGLGAFVLLLSPAAQFYGRSGIHETLLVLSFLVSLVAFDCWLQEVDRPSPSEVRLVRFANFFWLGLAAALALKETTSLFVASGVMALWVVKPVPFNKEKLRVFAPGFLGLLVFLFVIYSGFLQDIRGVLDFFVAYLPWFKTGIHGSGHEKIFFYWAELLIKNDFATSFLALIAVAAFWNGSRKLKFFVVWAWLQFLIYSLIPYKTPWCLIAIQIGLVFSGTLAVVEICETQRLSQMGRRVLTGLLILTGVAGVPGLYQTSLAHPLNLEHPFFYVQTEYGFKSVVNFLKKNRDLIGEKQICVATAESWPLPWWMHEFNIKYLSTADEISVACEIHIYDINEQARLEKALGADFVSYEFETRQSRQAAIIFIRKTLREKMKGEL